MKCILQVLWLWLMLACSASATIVFDGSSNDSTDDGDGDADVEWRCVITSGLTSASGNQAQVSFRSGSSSPAGATPTITGAAIGQGAGSGSTSFTGNQKRLTFSASNTFNITGAGQTVTSDVVTLGENFDNTKNYIVSFRAAAATNSFTTTISGATFTGMNCEFLGGSTAGDEQNTAPQGSMTSQASVLQFLRQIIITSTGSCQLALMGVGC